MSGQPKQPNHFSTDYGNRDENCNLDNRWCVALVGAERTKRKAPTQPSFVDGSAKILLVQMPASDDNAPPAAIQCKGATP